MGQTVGIFLQVVGGLGIFLLGMKNMSEGMQAVAGERLRKLIRAVTNNRIMACGVGTVVTSIIQSSSITTVLTIGMVNAGLMTLTQSIGVNLGANIGTTITGWILVIDIGKYGLPLIGFAAFSYLFSKKDGLRFISLFAIGLGMVFFGLELMKAGFGPIKDMPAFEAWFSRFQPDSYIGVLKCVAVGAAVTAIVQSSSATLGITIALALTGAIDYRTSAALVLGENIGTTVTALLASFGTTTNAKRVAYAHVLFKVIGVIWITPIFFWYTDIVSHFVTRTQAYRVQAIVSENKDPDIADCAAKLDVCEECIFYTNGQGQHVNKDGKVLDRNASYVLAHDFRTAAANSDMPDLAFHTSTGIEYRYAAIAIAFTHTGFNIVNTVVWLPFVGWIASLLTRLIPDKKVPEKPHLTYLNIRLLDAPSIGIQQSYKELIQMGQTCLSMLGVFKSFLTSEEFSQEKEDEIFQKENDLDLIQKEVVEFIGGIMTGSISHELMQEASGQIRIADELESISDYIQGLLKLRLKMRDSNLKFSEGGLADMVRLHGKVDQYLTAITEGIEREDNSPEYFSEMQTKGLSITTQMKQCRSNHLKRVSDAIVSPQMSLIYTDMLTAYRRIKDHAFNIAEVLVGEK